MTSVTRFSLALCVATVLLFLPNTLRAQGDSRDAMELSSTHAQDNQGSPDNEFVAFNICVARSSAAFETSASLLFLQPSSGNLVFATRVNPFPFLTPHWNDLAVRPDSSPAFNVGIRYVFDGGQDIRLDWTHLNSYDNASAHIPDPLAFGQTEGAASVQSLSPPFLFGPPLPFADVNAVAHFNYNAVNLDTGLTLCVGSHVKLRPFAGLQGARISQILTTTFRSADGSLSFTDASKSSFIGVGPRLGLDMHYIARNFDFLGSLAGSTVIGTRETRIDFLTTSPMGTAAGLTPNVQFLTSPDSTQVIPCIDAKLGVSYSIPVGNVGIIKCEAGYQAAVYINAINQYSLSEVSNTPDFVPLAFITEGITATYLRTAAEYQSNFTVHGPYMKLSLQF